MGVVEEGWGVGGWGGGFIMPNNVVPGHVCQSYVVVPDMLH